MNKESDGWHLKFEYFNPRINDWTRLPSVLSQKVYRTRYFAEIAARRGVRLLTKEQKRQKEEIVRVVVYNSGIVTNHKREAE